MLIRKAYKFALMPSMAQAKSMQQYAGCCRLLWNLALEQRSLAWTNQRQRVSRFDQDKELKELKAEFPWFKDVPSQALQQVLIDLERSFKNFFEGRAEYPTRKCRGNRDSFRFPQGFQLDPFNKRIKFPKLGWMRYRKSQEITGKLCQMTISQSCGRWYVSIQVEQEISDPVHPSTEAVGVDVGIVSFATLSNGTKIEPLNSFRQHEKKLAWYQRKLSRKKKGSNNWKKEKRKVHRLHSRIANVRRDFLAKESTKVANQYAFIAVEDLVVKNMSASAKGTIEQPGKMVKQKAGLNKSILDQGWGTFRLMLEYKSVWKGGTVTRVPAHHTSQTCPKCGHVSSENRKTQERFSCVRCEYTANADLVAARNIHQRAGYARFACASDQTDASETHGSNLHGEMMAGTNTAGVMPGIIGL